jgi:hypothetical protein
MFLLSSQRDLQLLLLRFFQTPLDSPTPAKPDTTPFLRFSSDLLLLFHAHWRRGDYSVMRTSFLPLLPLSVTPSVSIRDQQEECH